jgi:hypothetical protein
MFFLRRLIGRLLFVALLGWLINKLRESDNPKAQKVGHTANRIVGGVFGTDVARRSMGRRARVGRSAGSAAVGGLLGYFFDPAQGQQRRARVKTFASERIHRNGNHAALPAATIPAGPASVSSAQSRSSIT